MVKKYIPNKGDVVWINFNPTRGSEQKGKRPAIIISPKSYNSISGLALLCPITSQTKGYPFEVSIEVKGVSGVVLTDQIRSIDWKERKIKYISSAEINTIFDICERVDKLINSNND